MSRQRRRPRPPQSLLVSAAINDNVVQCSWRNRGCLWKGNRLRLATHVDEDCPFANAHRPRGPSCTTVAAAAAAAAATVVEGQHSSSSTTNPEWPRDNAAAAAAAVVEEKEVEEERSISFASSLSTLCSRSSCSSSRSRSSSSSSSTPSLPSLVGSEPRLPAVARHHLPATTASAVLQDLEIRLSRLEGVTPAVHGTASIWKMDDFARKREQALREDRTHWTSPPFYVDRCGYRLQTVAFPNGHGPFRGTHLSIFVALVRGDYDAFLPWPFPFAVQLAVLDQSGDDDDDDDNNVPKGQQRRRERRRRRRRRRRLLLADDLDHYDDHYDDVRRLSIPTPFNLQARARPSSRSSSSSPAPTTSFDVGSALGFASFLPLRDLLTPDSKHLRDDAVFVRTAAVRSETAV